MEWREDLKSLYRMAGVAGKRCCFLLDETQIKYESFLEDINNILTSGEVPNLFPKVCIPEDFGCTRDVSHADLATGGIARSAKAGNCRGLFGAVQSCGSLPKWLG